MTNESLALVWEEKIQLHEAFMMKKSSGGIYMWGFKNRDLEVVWYVGKSTSGKGIHSRLRDHYLNIMSGRYQIPRGFLNGDFTTDECSDSDWKIEYGNEKIATTLRDLSQMERIYRGAHRFAHDAFARFAFLDVPNDELKKIEQQVILKLKPVINQQRAMADSSVNVEFKYADNDAKWLDDWLKFENARNISA